MPPKDPLQGFKVISVSFSKDGAGTHEFFVKEHSLRHQDEGKPPGRTLFTLNVPPYIKEAQLNQLFSCAGNVSDITVQPNTHNGYSVAYVVFTKREGLLKALQLSSLQLDYNEAIKCGLDQWIEDYNNSIVDPAKLTKEVNAFMLNYDKSADKAKKDSTTVVDDEGWTVVTKKGHKPGIANKESVQIKINDKITKTNKKKELKNFYTFQIRESKMKHLASLRKNFEEAKNKVNLMKNSRRFKPY